MIEMKSRNECINFSTPTSSVLFFAKIIMTGMVLSVLVSTTRLVMNQHHRSSSMSVMALTAKYDIRHRVSRNFPNTRSELFFQNTCFRHHRLPYFGAGTSSNSRCIQNALNVPLVHQRLLLSSKRSTMSLRLSSRKVLNDDEVLSSNNDGTTKSKKDIDNYYLVIVESPSKCKTIEKILNDYVKEQKINHRYKVVSCMGHIRDLASTKTMKKEKATTKQTTKKATTKATTMSKGEILQEKTIIDDPMKILFPYHITGIDLLSGQYKPIYTILPGKESLVNELQCEIYKNINCIGVVLATDPDREGEAMAWHLSDVLKLKSSSDHTNKDKNKSMKNYIRIRFTEITSDAIISAIQPTIIRDGIQIDDSNRNDNGDDDNCMNKRISSSSSSSSLIDYNLVQAQETRRIVDRLAGFTVSPILWKKIAPGLSAGRVQSVGMALVVQRERERLLYEKSIYYTINSIFNQNQNNNAKNNNNILIHSKLYAIHGQNVVNNGNDFTNKSNELKSESKNKIHLKNEQTTMDIINDMENSTTIEYYVKSIKSTKRSYRSPLPYKTSTLQQDGSRTLNNMPVQQVMRTAQQLYEQGLISYMRTDSTTLSQTAIIATKKAIENKYSINSINNDDDTTNTAGANSSKKNSSKKKKENKNIQEAHEAIRPSIQSSGTFLSPNEITFQSIAAESLYRMIYQRTLACLMKPLITNQTSVIIDGKNKHTGISQFQLRTSGSIVVDPGYTIAYNNNNNMARTDDKEKRGDDNNDNDENDDSFPSSSNQLPPLHEGQHLFLQQVIPKQHETLPPSRFTEASLVQELEALGVGRPSTYARIVQILRDRAYVGSSIPSSGTNTRNSRSSSSSSSSSTKGSSVAQRAAGGIDALGGGGGGGRGALVPSLSAFVVCTLLEKNCPSYVDPGFTAQMEDKLDQIASGDMIDSITTTSSTNNNHNNDDTENTINWSGRPHVSYLNEFYLGENGLAAQVKRMDEKVSPDEARRAVLPGLIAPSTDSNGTQNDTNDAAAREDIGLFIGPWGPYVVQKKMKKNEDTSNGKPLTVPLPSSMAADLASITLLKLKALVSAKQDGGYIIGIHPDDGRNIRLKTGRYGAYLQWGDDGNETSTMHSLPKSLSNINNMNFVSNEEFDDSSSSFDDENDGNDPTPTMSLGITIDEAVGYVSLPRTVSMLNELPIIASIGPYGPYLKYNNTYVNLHDRNILDIDAKSAEDLVADEIIKNKNKKGSARGVVAEIGEKKGNMITVKVGRFGRYINWKKINAKLPSEYNECPEELQLEEAWEIIEGKAATSNSGSDVGKRKASKKIDSITIPPPKRPLSAYLHFCAARRADVSGNGKSVGEISKDLSKIWAEITPEDRKQYEDLAASSKIEYISKKEEWEIQTSATAVRSKNKVIATVKNRKKLVNSKVVNPSPTRRIASPKGRILSSKDITTKRPKSAYLHFCQVHRPTVSNQYKSLGEITKELARMWSETNDRTIYDNLASEDKVRYEMETEAASMK